MRLNITVNIKMTYSKIQWGMLSYFIDGNKVSEYQKSPDFMVEVFSIPIWSMCFVL